MAEIRKYVCRDCEGAFWVDCDDTDLPNYCPFCCTHHDGACFKKSETTAKVDLKSEANTIEAFLRDKEKARKEIEATMEKLWKIYPGVKFDISVDVATLEAVGGYKINSYAIELTATM